MSRIKRCAALCALLLLIAPGCGSDDDGADGDGQTDASDDAAGATDATDSADADVATDSTDDAGDATDGTGDASDATDGAGDATDAADDGDVFTDGKDSGGDVDVEPDVPFTNPCTGGGAFITRVTGQVTDEAGEGLTGARAQACIRLEDETLICLFPQPTEAGGAFDQAIPADYECVSELAMRVLQPGSARAPLYCQLSLPDDRSRIDLTEPFVLHDTTPAATLPAAGDEASWREVVFSPALALDVRPDAIYPPGSYDALAMVTLAPTTPGTCDLPAGAVTVHGFYPEIDVDAGFAPDGFAVRVPNDAALAPGAEVDLYVLGGLECHLRDGSLAHEGVWEPVGRGVVSDDGAVIESAPGQGLPCLTWFTYAPAE